MAIKKTLGGNRLGSGAGMDFHLRTFRRSSHNLGYAWRSSMAPGTLNPCFAALALNGDTWYIDIEAFVRTLPTNGPLFGNFKLQVDFFLAPIRLYHASLHNDQIDIGDKMENILLPQMRAIFPRPDLTLADPNLSQIDPSSLLAYLDFRGPGKIEDAANYAITRTWNALDYLMYYDIYKCFYANKQETDAVIIGATTNEDFPTIREIGATSPTGVYQAFTNWYGNYVLIPDCEFGFTGTNLDQFDGLEIYVNGDYVEANEMGLFFTSVDVYTNTSMQWSSNSNQITIGDPTGALPFIRRIKDGTIPEFNASLELKKFPLKNIDQMRREILGKDPASPLYITKDSIAPYNEALKTISNSAGVVQRSYSYYEMCGLAVKTYQSDRFNNWLSKEGIDGANGIAKRTAVSTASGSFTMDSLNFAEKLYNKLNRIAASGNTYYDWQEASYGVKSLRRAETPMYMGGMSSDINFSEVVSTAESSGSPLGTLGGRGFQERNKRGGRLKIKVQEPSYIMAIVSLTPRIDYSQGNHWRTRLKTMGDLHTPDMDGIGYQELLTDEFAAWDTTIRAGEPVYKSVGKQPAWIHYMTEVNRCYGNFAKPNAEMFMTLNRRYEHDGEGNLKDGSTYIDPSKFNYAFAVQELKAQNFWVQLGFDVTTRRIMSAKVIPNM